MYRFSFEIEKTKIILDHDVRSDNRVAFRQTKGDKSYIGESKDLTNRLLPKIEFNSEIYIMINLYSK